MSDIFLHMWHQTIERIRPGEKTERGSVVPDWDNSTVKSIDHCLFQSGSAVLDQNGRVLGIQEGATACAPVDADIKAGDRIRYDGDIYIIDGKPLVWKNVGKLDHMKLNLRRWTG